MNIFALSSFLENICVHDDRLLEAGSRMELVLPSVPSLLTSYMEVVSVSSSLFPFFVALFCSLSVLVSFDFLNALSSDSGLLDTSLRIAFKCSAWWA